MSPPPLIFVSAVTKELKSARQLVVNTLRFLGYEAVWQEIFGTESGDLRGILSNKIDQCRGVVQLVGQCYGAEPPEPDAKYGRVSYTQYEALYARDRGMRVWYLVVDETFPVDEHAPEAAELRELQAEYRRRVRAETHIAYHLSSREALEGSVLKLRDDFSALRRRARRWAILVVALLIASLAVSLWLLRTQRQSHHLLQQQNAEVSTLVDRYRKMEEAMVRLAEVETQTRQQSSKMSPEERRLAAYAVLEKELELSPGTLAKELPAFALQLYSRSDTTALMRARAAYALNRFEEAEKLSLDAADADERAYEAAQRVQEERRRHALEGYILAGQSAQQRANYEQAMQHLRGAEKLALREQHPEDWAAVQYAIADVLLEIGDYRNIEALLPAAIEVRARVFGPTHRDTLRARTLYAIALVRGGKLAEGEAQLRELIEIERKALGPDDVATLATTHRLG